MRAGAGQLQPPRAKERQRIEQRKLLHVRHLLGNIGRVYSALRVVAIHTIEMDAAAACGLHGQRNMWKVMRMDELDALAKTVEALCAV